MENLYNVTQTAYILKVHPLTVRRYIREGKLKAIKAGGNIRIKESDLQNLNKEVVPNSNTRILGKETKKPVKIFGENDPFFQLQGRGAALNIS